MKNMRASEFAQVCSEYFFLWLHHTSCLFKVVESYNCSLDENNLLLIRSNCYMFRKQIVAQKWKGKTLLNTGVFSLRQRYRKFDFQLKGHRKPSRAIIHVRRACRLMTVGRRPRIRVHGQTLDLPGSSWGEVQRLGVKSKCPWVRITRGRGGAATRRFSLLVSRKIYTKRVLDTIFSR